MINKSQILTTQITDFQYPELSILASQEPKYFWTRNPFYVSQYMSMVHQNFQDELRIDHNYNEMEKEDLYSKVMVGVVSNEVVMGFRITANKSCNGNNLYSSNLSFSYSDVFPELDLLSNDYAELSRFTAKKDFRSTSDYYQSCWPMIKGFCDEQQSKYLFIIASKSRLKLYNRVGRHYFSLYEIRDANHLNIGGLQGLDVYVACWINEQI